MQHEFRRTLPRMPIEWVATCHVESDTDERDWRCSVIDVSPAGAGVEIPDASAAESFEGQPVTIRIELRGIVRNTSPLVHGGLRLGVQFAGPAGEDAEELQTLRSLGIRW